MANNTNTTNTAGNTSNANNANIEEIFAILSREKKSLKPDYAYKTAEEGLLSAHHFFRWCKKSNLETLDKIVEQFSKKKVPEQQVEHFGAALVMIEHYQVDPVVKEAIRTIEDGVKEKTGKSSMEMIESPKVERRIFKNVYTNFNESIDRLKTRSVDLKKSSAGVWIFILILLLANAALVVTGIYRNLLQNNIPQILADTPVLQTWGDYILALVIFGIPSFIVLFVNRHKLSEHGKKGGEYPEEIEKMKKTLDEYGKLLEEKKIQIKTDKSKE